MSAADIYWQIKIDALLCRWPGQAEATGLNGVLPECVLQADRAAFALNQSAAAVAQPDWSAVQGMHPLLGEKYTLDGMDGAAWAAAGQFARRRAEDIARQYQGNPKQQFMALWRLLAEPPAAGILSGAARQWWRLFPADPSRPAALLWEHQSLVSALAGTADPNGALKPALLQFNIADTQPFVTRARRTQDLWAGSYLLSFLCWQLLKHFADTYGPDCILQPLLRGQPLVDLWLREEIGLHEVTFSDSSEDSENRLWISNIPNIFTVLLPEDQVETAVAEACVKMLAKWGDISGAVRKTLQRAAQCSDQDWHGCGEIWERQQNGFLKDNLFWAAVPLPAGPLTAAGLTDWQTRNSPFLAQTAHDIYAPVREALAENPNGTTGGLLYGLCSQLTARLLSDRKRARDFDQVDEPGQKCSLSGALQAVYPTPLMPGGDLVRARDWWQKLAQFDAEKFDAKDRTQIKMAGHIRRGDRLCAIQATKRLMLQSYFQNRHSGEPQLDGRQFPSTAGIANARFIAAVLTQARESPTVHNAVGNYVQAVRSLLGEYFYPSAQLALWNKAAGGNISEFSKLDAECLYEEFYDEAVLKREFGDGIASRPDFEPRLKAAKAARQDFFKVLGGSAGCLSRYYAIIALDGDSMGDWISGKKASVTPGPALHLALTSALSGFALQDARRIVETTHAGKLIYAGGDDVLALVPVSDLLPVLDALYRAYRGLEPGTPYGFVDRGGVRELRMGEATLSAGVAIVHEAAPLSYAVEQARLAEHDAKGRHGRDAFAIRLLKRSGGPVEIGAKWRVDEVDVPQAVLAAADLMRDGILSSKIAYTLLENRVGPAKLQGDAAWPPDALRAAQKAEFVRLASRHLTGSGKQEALRRLAPLTALVSAADPAGAKGERMIVGWEDGWTGVQGLLRLARMIAEEA